MEWITLLAHMLRNLPAMWESWVRSLGWEDPLEKELLPTPVFLSGEFHGLRSLANYSPWGCRELDMTEELTLSHSSFPGGASGKEPTCQWRKHETQVESASNVGDLGSVPGSRRSPGGGYGNPLQYSCLENPMDRGAWQAAVHSVRKSQTRLK